MAGLVMYCRAGFEKDLANEIQEKANKLEVYGYAKANHNDGFVVYECYQQEQIDLLARKLPLNNVIFARQHFAFVSKVENMETSDRISPILDACSELPPCGELRVEHSDTTDGRELSRFCKKFTVPLRQALRKKGRLVDNSGDKTPVLHLFFIDNQTAFVGYSYPYNNSPHPLGILRLKFPGAAPSRSTLKLDEAFLQFVPENERESRIIAGSQAVDLGACPGGWTYQLVKRGMFVQAVDNGAMDEALMETGQVKYFPEDGFKFKPKKKNIAWLVCDMIEQPQRVAKLMANWVADDWCKEAMFNLKLPMKKRYESVQESLNIIHKVMKEHGNSKYKIQLKHLYHDREEVTVNLRKI